MTARLKVLIPAYACTPCKGSEPGVGWGFVSELAKHHDLWVIVEEEKFRADIERYLVEHPEFRRYVNFFFIHKQDEEPRMSLAMGAVRRAQDFSWQRKIEVVNAIYRKKLDDVIEQGSQD